MDRREFLRVSGFLAALAAWPKMLGPVIESPPQFLGLVKYNLGFVISQEMIEDDIYATYGNLGGMARILAEDLDRRMAEKYPYPAKRGPKRLLVG